MKRFASLLLLAPCLVASVFAQDITGTIGGTVLDPSGAVVRNAKVTVTNKDRNQVAATLTTDASGAYLAPNLPMGTYSVKVEAPGFKTKDRTAITLNAKDNLTINMSMEVGAVTE